MPFIGRFKCTWQFGKTFEVRYTKSEGIKKKKKGPTSEETKNERPKVCIKTFISTIIRY